MKHSHKLCRFIALVMAVVLTSAMATANAVPFTYSDTYGSITVGSAAGWAGVSLAKFDPSLGTLTKVTLTLDSNTSPSVIGWDNEAGIASDVTLGIGTKVTINAFSIQAVTTMPLQTGLASVTADNDGWPPDYGGSDAFLFIGGSGSNSNSNSSTDAGVLALFTGVGTFDVWLSSSISTLVSTTTGWGSSITVAGQTSGTISITYEDIPIPEPATVTLLGLSGVVLIMKRSL
jgi:hypothetical protein